MLKKGENLRGGPPRKSAEEIEMRPKLLKKENTDNNEGIPTKKKLPQYAKKTKKAYTCKGKCHLKNNCLSMRQAFSYHFRILRQLFLRVYFLVLFDAAGRRAKVRKKSKCGRNC